MATSGQVRNCRKYNTSRTGIAMMTEFSVVNYVSLQKKEKKIIHDSNRCNKMKRMLALEYHHNNTCASTQSNLSN